MLQLYRDLWEGLRKEGLTPAVRLGSPQGKNTNKQKPWQLRKIFCFSFLKEAQSDLSLRRFVSNWDCRLKQFIILQRDIPIFTPHWLLSSILDLGLLWCPRAYWHWGIPNTPTVLFSSRSKGKATRIVSNDSMWMRKSRCEPPFPLETWISVPDVENRFL